MLRHIFAPIALLTLTAGCTLSPLNDTALSSTDEEITFWGFALSPGHEIDLRCWYPDTPNRTEPYVTFNLTFSSNEPYTVNGESVYPFQLDAVVFNEDCWTPVPGEGIQEAFVQTYDNPDKIHHDVYDQAGLACLVAEIGAGHGPITAGQNCRDPSLQGKGARLTAPL